MKIYDFSLASGYVQTGVDSAICVRANILQEQGHEVKLIFPSPPYPREFKLYTKRGLEHSQMLGMHSYFSDIHNFTPAADLQKTLAWLRNILDYSEEQQDTESIILKKDGGILASLQLTADQQRFYTIQYYKDGQLVRMDYYADVMYASAFYETKESADSYVSVAKERYFYNRDGSVALIQMLRGETEINILPDGSSYNRDQLFGVFVDRLDLTKEDLVILDRPMSLFSAKALLACHDRTNIVAVVHSEHFFVNGYSVEGEYLNREYWYWFKYSQCIDTMIVSTNEQKEVLKETLNTYGFFIPEIKVIPVMYLDKLRFPGIRRKRKSVVCISRLDIRKKIDWTICAIVKAHEQDKEITLDIYGTGNMRYVQYLEKLITDYNASDYIRLKGHMDVAEIYEQYEIFLTTSLWETFGITLLEAAGSGLAMVGFDVRYGNRLFIKNEENGYLVPYDPNHFNEKSPPEADTMAKCIVEIASNEEKLRAFSEKSYEIARQYLRNQIEESWKELLPDES